MKHKWIAFTDQYAISEEKKRDELIKKHAIQDCILDEKLWERNFIKNQFMYIRYNIQEIDTEEYKDWKKQFFFTYRKVDKVVSKMKEEVKKFDLEELSDEDYIEKVGKNIKLVIEKD